MADKPDLRSVLFRMRKILIGLLAYSVVVTIGLAVSLFFNFTRSSSPDSSSQSEASASADLSNRPVTPDNQASSPNLDDNPNLVALMQDIRDELVALRADRRSSDILGLSQEHQDLLGTLEEPLDVTTFLEPQGYVSIKTSDWQSVEVYSEPRSTAKVVATATYGDNYPFTDHDGNWYFIKLGDTTGWVNAQFFKEISDPQP